MNGPTALRIGSAVGLLVALASAGATPALGAEPTDTLGATVTANVYIADSRELSILNRSTVAVLVTAVPSGGWAVAPAEPVVLGVGESVTLQVVGSGIDGAGIAIRLRANQAQAPGTEQTEIVLGTRVYLDAPAPQTVPPWPLAVLGAALVAIVVVVLGVRRGATGRPVPGRGAAGA